LYYQDEKAPQGGDRRSPAFVPQIKGGVHLTPPGYAGPLVQFKTAEALGEMLGCSPRTVERAGDFVRAVHTVVANCRGEGDGEDIKRLLLNRKSRLSRSGVLKLAALTAAEQRKLVLRMLLGRPLPRGWAGEGDTMTVPRERVALAETLCRRLGKDWVKGLIEVLIEVLSRPDPEPAGASRSVKLNGQGLQPGGTP
jgi:hypothetical protein